MRFGYSIGNNQVSGIRFHGPITKVVDVVRRNDPRLEITDVNRSQMPLQPHRR